MAIYYIDGNTLSNSTSIFTDADLTICAPDGFYSDGINSRQQVGCLLLSPQVCASCLAPCGDSAPILGTTGVYLVDFNVGSSAGAIVLRFNPINIPSGVRVTFDGVIYNEFSSPIDGRHASLGANNFTYLGNTTFDCGISGTTYPALTEYEFTLGAFVATGGTQSITVDAGDVSLTTANPPGECVLVIPKLSSTPTLLEIEIVGPCPGSDWNLVNISCPTELTGFIGTEVQATSVAACAEPQILTYHNVPVNGSPGVPGLYDWIFQDQYAYQIATTGWYGIPGAQKMYVDAGVVTSISPC